MLKYSYILYSWSSNGQYLATGHYTGKIFIRNKEGKEIKTFVRKEPIWCLSWNPHPDYSLLL